MLQNTTRLRRLRKRLLLCSCLFIFPFTLHAQETTQPDPPAQKMESGGETGHEHPHHGKGRMGERHEHMEKMHREMDEELQRKLSALQAHSQTMSGITDSQQLLTEMKKHQQLSDDLLSTLIDQRKHMHTMMHEHHTRRHPHKGAPKSPGGSSAVPPEPPVAPQ